MQTYMDLFNENINKVHFINICQRIELRFLIFYKGVHLKIISFPKRIFTNYPDIYLQLLITL